MRHTCSKPSQGWLHRNNRTRHRKFLNGKYDRRTPAWFEEAASGTEIAQSNERLELGELMTSGIQVEKRPFGTSEPRPLG